nr:DUF1993 family protein [Reyranella sp.]
MARPGPGARLCRLSEGGGRSARGAGAGQARRGKQPRRQGRRVPGRRQELPFTVEGFLLSFSLPNFYFHATLAYTILRTKGVVPLGKRDYLGRLRSKS